MNNKPFRNVLGVFLGSASIFFWTPIVVYAAVSIHEIMYDASGTDSGREWIEIVVTDVNVVISELILYEGEVNHSLEVYEGIDVITSGSFAVIADNPETFLADYPDYSGTLIDSSFSLKNTGESLEIRDARKEILDSVFYLSEWGADGNGLSLQLHNGSWIESEPTPGAQNTDSLPIIEEGSTEEYSNEERASEIYRDKEKTIWANAGENKVGVVGAPIRLEGNAKGIEGDPLVGARYLWNVGDGSLLEGKEIQHTFSHPGEYVVALDVASGEYTSGDRTLVTVYPPDLKIVEVVVGVDGYVRIQNDTEIEINLEGWILQSGGTFFTFPRNTYIRSGKGALYPNTATHLPIATDQTVELLYPSGRRAVVYDDQSIFQHSNEGDTDEAFGIEVEGYEVEVVKNDVRIEESTTVGKSSINEEKIKDAVEAPFTAATEQEDAHVASVQRSRDDSEDIWFFMLLSLISLAVLAVLYIRRVRIPASEMEKLRPEDFDIVD